jgi:hypothetical protein
MGRVAPVSSPGPVDAAVLKEGAVVREAGAQCLVPAVGGGDGGDLFRREGSGYRGQPVEPPGKEVALPAFEEQFGQFFGHEEAEVEQTAGGHVHRLLQAEAG